MNEYEYIAIAGIIIGIIFGFTGYVKGLKEEAEKTGTIKTDINYIRRKLDDLYHEQKEFNQIISEHSDRITRIEEQIKLHF